MLNSKDIFELDKQIDLARKDVMGMLMVMIVDCATRSQMTYTEIAIALSLCLENFIRGAVMKGAVGDESRFREIMGHFSIGATELPDTEVAEIYQAGINRVNEIVGRVNKPEAFTPKQTKYLN